MHLGQNYFVFFFYLNNSWLLTSPRTGSGLLTTADSRTASCSINALSTSKGPIRYLEKKVSDINA